MPEVSVIVPNYNHARFLKQRIDSILNQTYQDFELILLDDCSTDNSRDIFEEYRNHPQVTHIVYNAQNGGTPFGQWQKGIALATGNWLWIAESDDYASPFFLETLIMLLQNHPEAGIAFGGSVYVDDNGEAGKDLSIYDAEFYRSGIEEIKTRMWNACSIHNVSSCIMKHSLAQQAISGLAHYKACGDWMFYVRMLHHTSLVFTPEKLNYFRVYHNNISSQASKNGLWISEGVDVLKYIRYKKVKFSPGAFRIVIDTWMYKAKTLKGMPKYRTMFKIAQSVGRYII